MKYPVKSVGLRHLDWVGLILSTAMPSHAKTLAMYLARFMNRDQHVAWPSYARMISELSISRQTVARAAGVLESEGWITRERGSGSNTRYVIAFPSELEASVRGIGASSSQELPRENTSSPQELGSSSQELLLVPHRNTNRQVNSQVIDKSANAFDAFWSAYPRKVDKKKARSAWQRLSRTDQDKALAHLASKPFAKTEKQFIPHPTTYLHGERWDDYEEKQSYAGAI